MKYKAIIISKYDKDDTYECEVSATNASEAHNKIQQEIAEYFGQQAFSYKIYGDIKAEEQIRVIAMSITLNRMYAIVAGEDTRIIKHILCLRYSDWENNYNHWINELSNGYARIFKQKNKTTNKYFTAKQIKKIAKECLYDEGKVRYEYKSAVGDGENLPEWNDQMEEQVISDINEILDWRGNENKEVEKLEIQAKLKEMYS
jgi:hypothetical protein